MTRNLEINDFDRIWEILESSTPDTPDSGIMIRRLSPDIRYDIFLGVEKPTNKRMLLLRAQRKFTKEFRNLPSFKGFDIAILNVPGDKETEITYGLILNDPFFKDIFTTLSEDIVNFASNETTEVLFFQKIKSRLGSWQHFLDQYGPQGLSNEAQRGLFGELRFLRDFLIPMAGCVKAIDAWKGPYRSNQDFQISGIAVEVKTSIAKQHQKITITNEQQLDDSGFKALFLFHLSLREIDDGGITLTNIVDDIRQIIHHQGGSVYEFENHLLNAGYLEKYRDRYSQRGYVDRAVNIFHINETFPRIVESDLKNGVGDVHYTLDLSACMAFLEKEEKFRSELGRIINDE